MDEYTARIYGLCVSILFVIVGGIAIIKGIKQNKRLKVIWGKIISIEQEKVTEYDENGFSIARIGTFPTAEYELNGETKIFECEHSQDYEKKKTGDTIKLFLDEDGCIYEQADFTKFIKVGTMLTVTGIGLLIFISALLLGYIEGSMG